MFETCLNDAETYSKEQIRETLLFWTNETSSDNITQIFNDKMEAIQELYQALKEKMPAR